MKLLNSTAAVLLNCRESTPSSKAKRGMITGEGKAQLPMEYKLRVIPIPTEHPNIN